MGMALFFIILGLILWSSVCEWILHRYVMYRVSFRFRYAYEAHAKVHHNIYKSDNSYHVQRGDDGKKIAMAKWNGIVISILAGIPMIVFGYWMFILAFIISMSYYGVYEFMHWCMHMPKRRSMEYMMWFRKLNGHHLLHHRYVNKNYNVVLPFGDLIFGTLMIRSPIKFKQCKSAYCLPDVQPMK